MNQKSNSWISVVALLLVVFLSFTSYAYGAGLCLQSEQVHSGQADSFFANDITLFTELDKKWSGGLNAKFILENDYTKIKPYVIYNLNNKISGGAAVSTDSSGADFLQANITFSKRVGDFSYSLSPYYYLGLSDEAADFFEAYVDIRYALTDRVSLGFEVIHDQWIASGDSIFIIGPALHFKLFENTILYGRITSDSNFDGESYIDLKAGITWLF